MNYPAKEWREGFRAKWEGANIGESIGTRTMNMMLDDIQNLLTTHSAHLVERLDGLSNKHKEYISTLAPYQMTYENPFYVETKGAIKALDQAIDIVKDKDNGKPTQY